MDETKKTNLTEHLAFSELSEIMMRASERVHTRLEFTNEIQRWLKSYGLTITAAMFYLFDGSFILAVISPEVANGSWERLYSAGTAVNTVTDDLTDLLIKNQPSESKTFFGEFIEGLRSNNDLSYSDAFHLLYENIRVSDGTNRIIAKQLLRTGA